MERYCLLPLHDDVLLPYAVLTVQLGLDHKHSEALLSLLNREGATEASVAVFPVRTDSSDKAKKRLPYLGSIGVLGQVLQISRLPGVRKATLILEGRHRLSLQEVYEEDGVLRVGTVRVKTEDGNINDTAKHNLVAKSTLLAIETACPTVSCHSRTRRLMDLMAMKGREAVVERLLEAIEKMTPGEAADSIGSVLATSFQEKESLLNETSGAKRVQLVSAMVDKSTELVEKAISIRRQQRVTSTQPTRPMELQSGDEISELLEKIEKKKPPAEVLAVAQREAKKLQRTSEIHPTYGMSRTYLETLASVPFNQLTPEAQDNVEHAQRELDSGHFGLENAKQRILEYVAVQKISKRSVRGPILCFVGPPGVGLSMHCFTLLPEGNGSGKTSLAQGMAKALGRKYVRVSLGGVRDEAEIRGHRRTYIGSMPGRIISGLCQIGVSDCVMLLDELDKMGHDIRGNPAAALLEVLDPEQNHAFVDTYLGVPVDLSRVIFLATANRLNELPAALLDRLEVIKLSGYTIQEKISIAQRHLIPKVVEENGLRPLFEANKLEFPVRGVQFIIKNHTMSLSASEEVGVRGLERCLSSICRHCATTIALRIEKAATDGKPMITTVSRSSSSSNEVISRSSGNREVRWEFAPDLHHSSMISVVSPLLTAQHRNAQNDQRLKNGERRSTADMMGTLEKIVVDEKLIETVLGPPNQQIQSLEQHLKGAGVAAGLVWTPFGGSVQYIECCITNREKSDHQGLLTLTGQLGDVLEESAQIAMSWIKSHSMELRFPDGNAFQNCDVHLHLPSGGVQKDGPSAGITLAVAMVSLFSGRQVRADTAMTGELSLRGLVLPIGGLKEKLIAAQQAGLKRVIIPEGNSKQLDHDIPTEVRNSVEVYEASKLDDVLLLAFDPPYVVQQIARL